MQPTIRTMKRAEEFCRLPLQEAAKKEALRNELEKLLGFSGYRLVCMEEFTQPVIRPLRT